MAKKGGIQQLQAEIYTDEDLEAFLKREGVLVIDVFSWAGPCVGMIGYLKKAKLEIGGDFLHLAIARSDSVEKLKRFRNRSEPTWLFCSCQKIINMMLGCNVPKLMAIIIQELKNEEAYREKLLERTFYEFNELLPEEQEREVLKQQLAEETERLEKEQAILQRKEYIRSMTDQIMEHIHDMGITMFMPHIMKDAYRKTADIADKMELSCKDRKTVRIKPEMMEVLYYEIDNPLPDEILEYLYNKEVLLFLWKLGETDTRTPEEVLNIFHKTVAVANKVYDETGEKLVSHTPAILESAEYVVGYEPVIEIRQTEKRRITQAGKKSEPQAPQQVLPTHDENGEPIKKFVIPPCWTPQNKRANAAFIYIFFRNHTDHFLPPDVPPVPQHLLFVFDAYKRHNIFEICKEFAEDILSYGYFNSEDIGSCTLLAKTTEKYDTLKPTVNDKLMMKIAKMRSDIVKKLSAMGPCYVSKNTIDGKTDCDRLFPPDYNVPEEEEQENDSCENGSKKKKKKRRKKREKAEGEADQSQSQTADQMSVQDSEDTLDDLSADEEELNNDDKEEHNAPPPSPNPQ
ncbi:hypothetical protein PVAND_014300 [Polypedilum vanderplanki]|uniref:DUF4746 domain-containing protein n=1 Tax=Polypedilum vanderplanki TaxID=319348 RepID=A0A9J6CTM7_POLVA|nr:hypothetical protein PVAND_014300 [Polypedilum vanderplanki]